MNCDFVVEAVFVITRKRRQIGPRDYRSIVRVPEPRVQIGNRRRTLRPAGIPEFVNPVLDGACQMLIAGEVNHEATTHFAQRGIAPALRPAVGIQVTVELAGGGRARTDLQVAKDRLAQRRFHRLPEPVLGEFAQKSQLASVAPSI